MKVAALIPYWDQYQYGDDLLFERDEALLGGKVLLNYPIRLANSVDLIGQTYLFTNNHDIAEKLDRRLKFSVLARSLFLDSQDVSIEEIIKDFLSRVNVDIVVLLHPSAPFVTKGSLGECVRAVLSGNYDSAFLARIEKKFTWYENSRLNYTTENGTPHISSLRPVTFETSSAYIFTKDCFASVGTRIGNCPYIKSVNYFEGLIVGSPDEAQLAEYLLDSEFYIKHQINE